LESDTVWVPVNRGLQVFRKLRAIILPILGGLLFFAVMMGVSLGIIELNAAQSPTVPWFPLPAIGLIFLVTWWVSRRWPVRLNRPVGGRAYVVTLLLTYAVICLGVLESWVNNVTTPAPMWPDESVSTGFQLTFLLVLPFIAAVLAEVGFRGLMQTALEKVLPLWPMLFLLAVLNFLMHSYDPEQGGQLLRLLGLNFAWGYMTWRTQSLRPALAGHIAMNIFVPLLQYGSEQYGPGPVPFGEFPPSTLAISAVGGLVALGAALALMKVLPGRQ
jgi:membrane protease YdiL (CAAX protease family)